MLSLICIFSLNVKDLFAQEDDDYEIEHRLIGSGTFQGVKFEKFQKRKVRKKKGEDDRDIYISPVYKQDGDGDGVTGPKDKCPNTPKEVKVYVADGDSVMVRTSPLYYIVLERDGIRDTLDYTYVNAEGCLPDFDGDGIPDVSDVCPKEPGPRERRGCPEKDDDGDGVPDELDKCPELAGSPEFDGCPDTDGDKVPDNEDQCPDVPGIKELFGCPDKPDEVDLKIIEAASRVRFRPNSADIDLNYAYVLDEFYELLVEKFPTAKIELIGHTDNRPLPAGYGTNQTLSENRSKAVKDYLVSKGIDAVRISTDGKGFSEPIDTNETSAGRANNRRVEIKVLPQVEKIDR